MTDWMGQMQWQGVMEGVLVAAFAVLLFRLTRGTRIFQMLVGAILIAAVVFAARWIGLWTGIWATNGFWGPLALILVILFQPEIRRGLAQVGRSVLFHRTLSAMEETRTLDEIIRAVIPLAEKQIGAIIVVERENELWDIVEMGIKMDAKVSRELLTSIFMPQSPLHDGAVVIRADRIIAAGCFLPLSLNPDIGRMLGTRHRAALGITEETDAAVITVSEETGAISVIMGGNMTRDLDSSQLRRVLTRIFLKDQRAAMLPMDRVKGLFPVRGKR